MAYLAAEAELLKNSFRAVAVRRPRAVAMIERQKDYEMVADVPEFLAMKRMYVCINI